MRLENVVAECVIARIPVTQNRMLRMHFRARGRDKESWRLLFLASIGRNNGFKPDYARLHVHVYRHTRQDADNAVASIKNLQDALVNLGWLTDDSPKHMAKPIVNETATRNKQQHRTEVVIERLARPEQV